MSKEKKQRNNKIHTLRKKGLSLRKIAKIYHLNHKTIFDIVGRKGS